jgi:hypothetical protein
MKYNACIIKEEGGITTAHLVLVENEDREPVLARVRDAMKLMRDVPKEWNGEIRITPSPQPIDTPACEKDGEVPTQADNYLRLQAEYLTRQRTSGVDYEVPAYVEQPTVEDRDEVPEEYLQPGGWPQ